MPIPILELGATLIGAARSFRRPPDPIVRDVQIADDGQVHLIPGGRLGRGFQSTILARAESILTAFARGERELTAEERRSPIIRDWAQAVQDWRAFNRELQEPPEPGPEDFDEPDRQGAVFGGEQLTPVGPEDFFMPRFVRAFHKSIPGGAAGMSQQTPATIARIGGSLRGSFTGRVANGSRRRRRSRGGVARSRAPGRRRRRSAGPARLVKGSAAARRHMAKLRGMRKRRK